LRWLARMLWPSVEALLLTWQWAASMLPEQTQVNVTV
jgi:hypothetical protein